MEFINQFYEFHLWVKFMSHLWKYEAYCPLSDCINLFSIFRRSRVPYGFRMDSVWISFGIRLESSRIIYAVMDFLKSCLYQNYSVINRPRLGHYILVVCFVVKTILVVREKARVTHFGRSCQYFTLSKSLRKIW